MASGLHNQDRAYDLQDKGAGHGGGNQSRGFKPDLPLLTDQARRSSSIIRVRKFRWLTNIRRKIVGSRGRV